MTTVLIVRHGETDWNRAHRWQGHVDPPLNDTGEAQAQALASELAGASLDAIYSSDLLRARQTADAVAHVTRLPVVVDPALREIDVGEWTGMTTDEIKVRFPEAWERHSAGGDGWEHGETHAAMSDRIVSAVSRIAEIHPEGRILCVLHGGVIRALLAHASGVSLGEYRTTRRGPANGVVSTILVEAGIFGAIDS